MGSADASVQSAVVESFVLLHVDVNVYDGDVFHYEDSLEAASDRGRTHSDDGR